MMAGPRSQSRPGARLAVLVAAALVLSSPLTPGGGRSSAQSKSSAWTSSVVPAAKCGPGERTESGLQGQTTSAERFSAKATQAYNCNLELLGQFEGEGAQFAMAAIDNCGYFSTAGGAAQQHKGTVVVDATDRRHPKATAYLDTIAMLNPNEGLDSNN